MRIVKHISIALTSLLLAIFFILWLTGNSHIYNGITKTYLIGKSRPDIDDMNKFSLREIENGKHNPWLVSKKYNQRFIEPPLLDSVVAYQTRAFLVVKDDSIRFEKYWGSYTDTTYSNSFSMAKSFTSMLIGCAIEDGYIKGVYQPVGDFLPQFSEGKGKDLTIEHLLQMRSGIPFGESYSSPFGYMAKAYYGKNLQQETEKYGVEEPPGQTWEYEGGNTVLLALILNKATGKTISNYFSEKIWQPIGSKKPAYWNLDKTDGLEKTFSAFYTNARDFARLGKLYMDSGKWLDQQLVPEQYVRNSLEPVMAEDRNGKTVDWYGYHWWLGEYENKPFFSARGMRGQYILVIPEDRLIVVRLGHTRSNREINYTHMDLFQFLEIAYNLIDETDI